MQKKTMEYKDKNINILISHNKRLQESAISIIKSKPPLDNSDFKEMYLHFLSKQITHMDSILLLKDSRDSLLIARSMLEGLVLLMWTAGESKERAKLWKSYAYVVDYKTIKRKGKENVDAAKVKSTNDGFKNYKDLRFKISEEFENIEKTERNYKWVWHPCSLRGLFKKVGGRLLYDVPYKYMSNWHHWNLAGLAEAFTRGENENIIFSPFSEKAFKISLLTAFQSLYEILKLGEKYFNFGLSEELKKVYESYVNFMKQSVGEYNL